MWFTNGNLENPPSDRRDVWSLEAESVALLHNMDSYWQVRLQDPRIFILIGTEGACGTKPPGLFRRRPGSWVAQKEPAAACGGLGSPEAPPPILNEFPQPRCDLLQSGEAARSPPHPAERRERSEETGLDKLCAVCGFDAESKNSLGASGEAPSLAANPLSRTLTAQKRATVSQCVCVPQIR